MTIENSGAQTLIDKEIGYHLDCVRKLRSQRNELSPISKLHPEILSIVFCFLVAGHSEIWSPLPCYNFTHVSQSWRDVALNTPELWQVLFTRSIPWATAFLERSKGADLTIGPFKKSIPVLARIPFLKRVFDNHASQIRHLYLADTYSPSLASLFQNVRPLSFRPHSLELTSTAYECPTFPSGIIDTQSLQKLDVDRCEGPWYSLSFPVLTSLRLCGIPNPLCLPKFLGMLRALSPTLTSLDIDDSFPVAGDSVSGVIHPVRLPNLQLLHLYESMTNASDISNILPSVIVPPTATIKIFTRSRDVILGELASPLWKFLSHWGSYSALEIYNKPFPFFLTAWQDEEHDRLMPYFELILELERFATPISQLGVQQLLLSLPLMSNITKLTLGISPLNSLLQNPFGRLPYLQTVALCGQGVVDFIEALTYKPEHYNTEASAYYSVTFPALQSLSIHDFLFEEAHIEQFLDCLIERCERKAGLRSLQLWYCSGFYGKLKRLQEIVVDVETILA